MNPDSMSGCVYKNGLPEVVAMIFSVSISFVDTVLAPGDFKKNHEKKGATFAQEIRPKKALPHKYHNAQKFSKYQGLVLNSKS